MYFVWLDSTYCVNIVHFKHIRKRRIYLKMLCELNLVLKQCLVERVLFSANPLLSASITHIEFANPSWLTPRRRVHMDQWRS